MFFGVLMEHFCKYTEKQCLVNAGNPTVQKCYGGIMGIRLILILYVYYIYIYIFKYKRNGQLFGDVDV